MRIKGLSLLAVDAIKKVSISIFNVMAVTLHAPSVRTCPFQDPETGATPPTLFLALLTFDSAAGTT